MPEQTQDLMQTADPVEKTEIQIEVPEIKRYRVTRPSSTLHGKEGRGFSVMVETEGPEPEKFFWIRFEGCIPSQGWFEECEAEEIE